VSKIKISAVSYTNTKPFVYGLQHSNIIDLIDLSLDIPSDCAKKLIEGQVDIGLVPVVALLDIPGYQIISDYCIGAIAAVNSVFIFSQKPLQEIQTLRLDSESRTSNQLAKVLLKNYWEKHPEFISSGDADAFVEIGDRTFGKKDKYPYAYDLAEEWIKFTGLPFTFAVWASNKTISADFIDRFNAALKFGLDNRDEVIKQLPVNNDFDLEDYLYRHIDFSLDQKKQEALNKFLDFVRALD
jgi:chorismate dehydratase